MKTLLIILFSFFLASCDIANKGPVKGSVDRTGKQIATTVYFYDSIEEVQNKFREVHNLSKSEEVKVQGFSQWPEFRDANGTPIADNDRPLTCKIYIVRPKAIDDEATTTLGHEMLHCIIGTYHP